MDFLLHTHSVLSVVADPQYTTHYFYLFNQSRRMQHNQMKGINLQRLQLKNSQNN